MEITNKQDQDVILEKITKLVKNEDKSENDKPDVWK